MLGFWPLRLTHYPRTNFRKIHQTRSIKRRKGKVMLTKGTAINSVKKEVVQIVFTSDGQESK